MDIEQIKKYLNKRIRLILKSGYEYIGMVTKVYESSFDFVDVKGNELSQDAVNVSTIVYHNESKSQVFDTSVHIDTPIQKDSKPKRSKDTKSKKEFIPSEEQLIDWASEPATEGQSRILAKMEYSQKDVSRLSKLDAWKIINEELKKSKEEGYL